MTGGVPWEEDLGPAGGGRVAGSPAGGHRGWHRGSELHPFPVFRQLGPCRWILLAGGDWNGIQMVSRTGLPGTPLVG